MKGRAFVAPFSPDSLDATVAQSLEWLHWEDIVPPDGRVFIKPNFTYPFYKEGVTTSPVMLEAVIKALKRRTDRITVGESDGGSHAWSADDAFAGHNLPDLCHQYGIATMNLSSVQCETVGVELGGHKIDVLLPSPLLHQTDVFISMPVPKVHAMTGVSLGFKNQWGCIPDVKRLRYHHRFTRYVLAINKVLAPRLVIFDGTYFLDQNGPMEGTPVRRDLLIAADGPGAGSAACSRLMGIDPASIGHLKAAMKLEMMPSNTADLDTNVDLARFQSHHFTLHRSKMNWVALAAFHSRIGTWFLYNSRFARPVHNVLYWIKGTPKDVSPYW